MLSRSAVGSPSSSSSGRPAGRSSASAPPVLKNGSAAAGAVADDDHLAGPRDRAEGIDRLDLARLVDDQEIEAQGAGVRNSATESGLIMNTGLIAWTARPARASS